VTKLVLTQDSGQDILQQKMAYLDSKFHDLENTKLAIKDNLPSSLTAFLGFLAFLGLVGLLRFLRAPRTPESNGTSVSVASASCASASGASIFGASVSSAVISGGCLISLFLNRMVLTTITTLNT